MASCSLSFSVSLLKNEPLEMARPKYRNQLKMPKL